MAASPIYGIPKLGPTGVRLTVAVTTRDGTTPVAAGGKTLLYTAGPNGGIFHLARARAEGTVTAGLLRYWLNNGSDDTVAANNTLIAEPQVVAYTASETSAAPPIASPMPITLESGDRIYVARTVAGAAAIAVMGEGVDF